MNDLDKVEIRVLELAPDYFTFRLPSGYEEEHGGIKSISLSFLAEKRDCDIYDFSLSREESQFWTLVKCASNNNEYRECALNLTKDYLEYINDRTELDQEEFSHARSSYPLNKNDLFALNRNEQYNIWKLNIEKDTDFEAWNDVLLIAPELQICAALEDDSAIDEFLDFGTSKLLNNLPKNHPLKSVNISRVYAGNPYCFCLHPDIFEISKLFRRAKEAGIGLTLVLPPISQTHFKAAISYISEVIDIHMREYHDISFELCLNDYGMLASAKNLVIKAGADIEICKGVLLFPSKRDPRKKYLKGYTSSNLMMTDDTLFAPLYQTNTGTFCTLKATVNKNRGAGVRVAECDRECLKRSVLYPLHLNMIGKYNSLFGFDDNFFRKPKELIDDIAGEKRIKRLVINW